MFAAAASGETVAELDDAAARMQYAFYTGDTQGIETILKNVGEFRGRRRAGREQVVSPGVRQLEVVAAVPAAAVRPAIAFECQVASGESGAGVCAPRASRSRARRCVGGCSCDRGGVRRSFGNCPRRLGRMCEQQAAAHGSGARAGQSAHQARAGDVRAEHGRGSGGRRSLARRRGQFRSRAAIAARQTGLGSRGSADDARRDLPAARRSGGGARCARARIGTRAGLSAGAATACRLPRRGRVESTLCT